jgi:hypothetical protein
MTVKDVVRAIAKEDMHDLLTPLSVVVAIEIAAKIWDDGYTKAYGTEIRDTIVELASQVPSKTT